MVPEGQSQRRLRTLEVLRRAGIGPDLFFVFIPSSASSLVSPANPGRSRGTQIELFPAPGLARRHRVEVSESIAYFAVTAIGLEDGVHF